MVTGIWKVEIQAGKRDAFMQAYDLFAGAEGFLGCQFYPSVENDTTLIAVETWENHEMQQAFMWSLKPEQMWELFGMMNWKPEMWWCEVGKLVK